MMTHKILPRSTWTTTSPGGKPIQWGRVRGIVCHYPGSPGTYGVLTAERERVLLRGWRGYHTRSLGWSDIGYSYGIGQSGRIYSLRGDRVGGHTYGHNSTTLGVLFIVGNDEPLTPAARAAFRALRATLRKRGAGSAVWGHREMPRNSTACPGPHIMADIRSGALTGIATVAAGKGTAKPVSKPTRKPSAGRLAVDGKIGPATARALQQFLHSRGQGGLVGPVDGKLGHGSWRGLQTYLRTPVDGRVSSQYRTARQVSPLGAITQGWEHVGKGARGSTMVRALQKWVGVKQDGLVGPDTVKALQSKLNAHGVGM